LELVNRVRTGQVTYTDYNYEHPKIPQEMTQAGELDQDLKQFDYPGRYVDPLMGQVRTTEWMSEHIVDNQQVEATSDVMRLAS
ncbi:type VI secretion system tip protein VgrG, partial [Vibrio parahaemolyticus]|nr:type VI secretion system tip protein VgrG [Vibrio parahaemolyticus]